MELQLKIIGVVLILLSLFHLGFERYFNWKEEFKNLSLINRQMNYVHTFFILLAILLMGLLCLFCAGDLVHTLLGKKICLGLSVFWGFRLLVQFFVYSSTLWRGKRFETIIHILFSFLWAYLAGVFFVVYYSSARLAQ
jgi:hypothetical protein